jgi:hypothetical protein
MTEWIPVEPVGDHHSWAIPASEPCPDCECCSRRLCERAREKNSACHWEATGSDFDLSKCPCWRTVATVQPVGGVL